MYSVDIAKIETYSVIRDDDGLVISETRVEVEVEPDVLKVKDLGTLPAS